MSVLKKENLYFAKIRESWPYLSLAIIAILLVLNLFLLQFYLKYSRVFTKTDFEKKEIQTSLVGMEAEFKRISEAYEILKEKNAESTNSIQSLEQQLQLERENIIKLAESGASKEVLEAEILKMKRSADLKINELIAENQKLKEIKNSLNSENSILKQRDTNNAEKISTLQQDNKQLESALLANKQQVEAQELAKNRAQASADELKRRRLQERSLSVGNISIKNIGPRNKSTNRAKKVEQSNICFDVSPDAEALIKSGDQDIYIQILGPAGLPLSLPGSEANYRIANGTELRFVVKKAFTYTGISQQVCANIDLPNDLTAGEYTIVFYHNGRETTRDKFELK